MPYSKLLKKVIVESGLSNKEVIKECEVLGKKFDKTYLSKLMNNKLPAPSADVSRIIAQVCKSNPDVLVLEGYLDKAPKEVMNMLYNIYDVMLFITLKVFSNTISKEAVIDLEKEMRETSLSEFLLNISNMDKYINLSEFNNDNIVIEEDGIKFMIKEPTALLVKDNSMYPILPKNSKVLLEVKEKYNNGDLLAVRVKINDKEKLIYRYVLFNDKEIVLSAINNEFETLTYNIKDISIIGKVSTLITKL